jgi:hypothetical protein
LGLGLGGSGGGGFAEGLIRSWGRRVTIS